MVRTSSNAPLVVLAGWHLCRDRMASPGCVSVGHAVSLAAQYRNGMFSNGWPLVLVARDAALAGCAEGGSLVRGSLPFPRHVAL